jgi:hypothetical protein
MLEILAKRRKEVYSKVKEFRKKYNSEELNNNSDYKQVFKLLDLIDEAIEDILTGDETNKIVLLFHVDKIVSKRYVIYITELANSDIIECTCNVCYSTWNENLLENKKCQNCEDNNILEDFAELCHEQWSGWMKYLFSKCSKLETKLHFLNAKNEKCEKSEEFTVIPTWAEDRWEGQMSKKYSELSEEEKESDRLEARRIFGLIIKILKSRLEKLTVNDLTYNTDKIQEVKELIKIFGGEINR